MSRAVWIDGARFLLSPSSLIGEGGEAEIYDLGDGRVVKWWKPPDHPDFVGNADAQAAANQRLAERPRKLRALPGRLPAAIVAPSGFALSGKRSTDVVGYVMPKVTGVPLHSYGEPRWRQDHKIAGADLIALLLALHDAIGALHAADVVIGDCNDLNVLVDGRRVHLIDVDSYQFAGFSCPMFSERFVDPRLCDGAGAWVHPHDRASDWFAFAMMAFRSLLWLSPWGGVHQPADPTKRCPPPLRALRRISVYAKDIIYPRASRPVATLPDELNAVFRAIFERDQRSAFPREQLEQLQLRPCATCKQEHARVRCPACQTAALLPPVVVQGRLRWSKLPLAEVMPASYCIGHTTPIRIDAGALWRSGKLGPERIGNVLANHTQAWASAKLGVGFYRAGGYTVGFVFRPDRGVLDDRVALPAIRGQIIRTTAAVASDRAWLFITTVDAGRMVTTCCVIAADGSVIACAPITEPWLAGAEGACAIGAHLFVPTDAGLTRIEVIQGVILPTRTFAETASLICSADRIVPYADGLAAARRDDALCMHLS
ncbi:MAG: hypothetical protein AB7O24_22485 [Kofleriaceae bacterium]